MRKYSATFIWKGATYCPLEKDPERPGYRPLQWEGDTIEDAAGKAKAAEQEHLLRCLTLPLNILMIAVDGPRLFQVIPYDSV